MPASSKEDEESHTHPSSPYPPLGVAILSIWNYVAAVLTLLGGIVSVVYPNAFSRHGSFESDLARFSLTSRLSVFTVAAMFSLLSFALGEALWNLRNWARLFVLVICAIELILGGPPSGVISRVISLVAIVYLLAPGVRAAFYAASESSAHVA